jgi:hypothetical protein
MLGFGPLHRPFNLYHANLSGQWLKPADHAKSIARAWNDVFRPHVFMGEDLAGLT